VVLRVRLAPPTMPTARIHCRRWICRTPAPSVTHVAGLVDRRTLDHAFGQIEPKTHRFSARTTSVACATDFPVYGLRLMAQHHQKLGALSALLRGGKSLRIPSSGRLRAGCARDFPVL
jgi:hypothetical protein